MSNLHATGISAAAAAKYCRVDQLGPGQLLLQLCTPHQDKLLLTDTIGVTP